MNSKPPSGQERESLSPDIIPVIEVEPLSGFWIDETYDCPNKRLNSDVINRFRSCDLSLDALSLASSRGCPYCNLRSNLIRALPWHKSIDKVQNPHMEISPFGHKEIYNSSPEDPQPTQFLFRYRESEQDLYQPMEVFTTHGTQHAKYNFYGQVITSPAHVSEDLPGNTGSQTSLNNARTWLSTCKAQHSRCGKGASGMPRLPTRLIRVESLNSVRLVETHGMNGIYACLSHCWGPKGHSKVLRTLRETICAFKESIPWALMPRTFRDAVMFSFRLGIPYIWIDSLCIIQDDEDDWEREAGTMAEVYENALVTFAATASSNADHGCFSNSSTHSPSLQIARAHLGNQIMPIYARQYLNHHIYTSMCFPLTMRAWVLQEMLLSPRKIHFLGGEISWECSETSHCECGIVNERMASSNMKQLLHYNDEDGERFKTWRSITTRYSGMRLTYESDRLPALSGVAARWSQKGCGDYLAGLWQGDLLNDMLWQNGHSGTRARPWRAPTWSWASVQSAPIFYSRATGETWHVAVKASLCQPQGNNKFGAISSGYVVLIGKTADAVLYYEKKTNENGYVWHRAYASGIFATYAFDNDVLVWQPGEDYLPPRTELKLLLMQSAEQSMSRGCTSATFCWTLLVLKASPCGSGKYERVGHLRVTPASPSLELERKFVVNDAISQTGLNHVQTTHFKEPSLTPTKNMRRERICEEVNRTFIRQFDAVEPREYVIV